ncbi:MAG: hypothetical protein K6G62_01070, partial [Eubacterium sp.]|nr:hypothetical protein [Eubacterium sp.]
MMEKVGVSVPVAKDGGVSPLAVETSKDCAVPKDMGSAVYTEAEARQLNMNQEGVLEETAMSPSDFISRCMTGEDAADFDQEGTP